MRLHRLQERERVGRHEVADARSGIEERDAARVEQVVDRKARAEIGDDADHLDLGEIRRHARERALDLGPRDVHRDVAPGAHVRQPPLRLAAIAGAEVDELASLAERFGDLGAMLAKKRDLRARRRRGREASHAPVD